MQLQVLSASSNCLTFFSPRTFLLRIIHLYRVFIKEICGLKAFDNINNVFRKLWLAALNSTAKLVLLLCIRKQLFHCCHYSTVINPNIWFWSKTCKMSVLLLSELESVGLVQRALRRLLNKDPPHKNSITRWSKQFIKTGSVQKRNSSWRPPVAERGPYNLAPKKPRLYSMRFFLWGYAKDIVYSQKNFDVAYLKERIYEAVSSVIRDMLHRVRAELDHRLDVCRDINGGHIEL